MSNDVRIIIRVDDNDAGPRLTRAERDLKRWQQQVKATDGAQSQAGGSGSKFGGILAGVGRAAAGVAVGLGVAAVSAGAMGLKTAASLEQAEISFTTLMGSADAAKKHMADLSDFAAKTPFELPGLIDASRQLQGAGESAKDVIPTLQAWGDASGALGQTQDQFGRTMTAVTQMMNKGKVSAEELGQITEANIPIWRLLAEATGKSVPELQKLMSKGELLTKDVLPALEKAMEKDYGGSMAKQSQTLSGQWSTLMDTLNRGLADVVRPLMPVIGEMMPGAMAVLGKALSGLAQGVKVGVMYFKALKDALEGNGVTSDGTVGKIERLGVALRAIGKWIQANVIPVVASLVRWFTSELLPAWQRAADSVMPALRDAMKEVGSTFSDNREVFAQIGGALKAIGYVITDVLIPVFAFLVRVSLPQITGNFRTFVTVINKIVLPAIRALATYMLNTMHIMINSASKAFGWVPGIGPKLRKAAADFNEFERKVNAALNGIKKNVTVSVNVRINGASARVTTHGNSVTVQQTGSGRQTSATVRALAHGGIAGGIPGAQGGGPRSGLTWVGERGPELAELQPGTRVYSHEDSMRMTSPYGPAQAQAQQRAAVVRFEGDGEIAQAFLRLLRMVTRISGTSDVQVLFGGLR